MKKHTNVLIICCVLLCTNYYLFQFGLNIKNTSIVTVKNGPVDEMVFQVRELSPGDAIVPVYQQKPAEDNVKSQSSLERFNAKQPSVVKLPSERFTHKFAQNKLNHERRLFGKQRITGQQLNQSTLQGQTDTNNTWQMAGDCLVDMVCTGENSSYPFQYSPVARTLPEIERTHNDVSLGGSWSPPHPCPDTPHYGDNTNATPHSGDNRYTTLHSRDNTAIVVPYRGREEHLRIFIDNIISFLKKQKKQFTVFVVEQVGPEIFNRALLANIGYLESEKFGDFTCFIVHDVDMVPVDLCNLYECPKGAAMRHLGLSRNLKHAEIFWPDGITAAAAFTPKIYEQINGFTNIMFGWGREDDEGLQRLKLENITIKRFSPHIGNYYHLGHDLNETRNPILNRSMMKSRENAKYRSRDGLNSAVYTVHAIIRDRLFTRIITSFPGPTDANGALKYFNIKTDQFRRLQENSL